jgi:xanthine/CO dehydrogenase XdhC/CoxF family maturation factor
MRENRQILDRARALVAAGEPAALATIVAVEGSAYRREGARMLLEPDGGATGVLSGGCLERDLARAAEEIFAGGAARVVTFDLFGDEEAIWGWGLGCAGRVTLLLESLAGAPFDGLERLYSSAIEGRRETRLATVFASTSALVPVGERWFLSEAKDKGSIEGKDNGAEQRAALDSLAALGAGEARSVRLESPSGALDLLVESLLPPPHLLVVGAERDVEALVPLAASLGWALTVIDPRGTAEARARFSPFSGVFSLAPRALAASGVELSPRTAVVVATHRYLDDVAFLAELLPLPLGYLAVLGPTRRKERILGDLAKLGVAGDLSRLRGPAGLDLGGRAPEEVALAIVAEIQAVLSGRSGRPYDASRPSPELAPGEPAPERA